MMTATCARVALPSVELRADAGDVALADGPLHGGGGVGADIGAVGEAGQRAGRRGRAM